MCQIALAFGMYLTCKPIEPYEHLAGRINACFMYKCVMFLPFNFACPTYSCFKSTRKWTIQIPMLISHFAYAFLLAKRTIFKCMDSYGI